MPSPFIATRREELAQALSAHRAKGETIGFVPTLGALHEGHASLLAESKRRNAVSVLSVFVNPKQFGPNEDFAKYPRTFQADVQLATAQGVDIVFAPTVAEMYPTGFATHVRVEGGMGQVLCGASRPGHFDGVTTVVSLLLNLVGATEAYFGLKDYQQFSILCRMASDLGLQTRLVGLPTLRESDGLAMSSRNRYLSAQERVAAGGLPRALAGAANAWLAGERAGPVLLSAVTEILNSGAGPLATRWETQYADLRDASSLQDVSGAAPLGVVGSPGQRAVLAIAHFVGNTRLIDNILLAEDDFHRGLLEHLVARASP
ncbi:MAG: pantoate--beta-alanine ligase [Silvanigrellales bacterium]|jgi:pantoate--beta-alanine ligase|nr:pantoate--beta-alanine ligase [Silvanigrellales bacterium]